MIFLANPLQYALHHDLRWRFANSFGFAAGMACVPVAASELNELSAHVPLVLRRQGNGFRVVVPLRPGWTKELIISEDGAWSRGPPPLMLRHHPFTLLHDGTGKGEPILAVAADPACLGTETGEPFFDASRQPSAAIKAIHSLLRQAETENQKLSIVIRALDALRLLRPLDLADSRGRRSFQTVSVPGLAALPGAAWAALAEHRLAIAQLTTALDRSQRLHLRSNVPDVRPDAWQARHPATEPPSSGFLVDEEVILSF